MYLICADPWSTGSSVERQSHAEAETRRGDGAKKMSRGVLFVSVICVINLFCFVGGPGIRPSAEREARTSSSIERQKRAEADIRRELGKREIFRRGGE